MWGKLYRDGGTFKSMASSSLKPRKPYPTRSIMVTAETCRDLFVVNDVDAAPSNLSWRWIGFESPKLLPCRGMRDPTWKGKITQESLRQWCVVTQGTFCRYEMACLHKI